MKRITVILLAVVLTTTMMAIPAKRLWKTLTLADGTQITAQLVGDENAHWWVDGEGRALTVDSLGIASYMSVETLSARKAVGQKRLSLSNARREQSMGARSLIAGQKDGAEGYYVGEKRGIVILVNFNGLSMKSANTQAAFSNQFNQVGYSKNGNAGSVRDYFLDQSYQKLTIDFDVVGPVTVSKAYSYYGANDENDEDKYPATMVIEACKLADAAGVDFSKYDWDGDGEVDQVFIIYAGYSESEGASSNTIWPHEWNLTEAKEYGDGTGPLTFDGVKIDTYAASSELCGTSGSTMNGVGSACHEFSHCLGFPDFYDSSYSGGAGMMDWDLLCSGSYNGPAGKGECPPDYTSYERACAGWLTPIELTDPCMIKDMPCLSDEPVAYILYNQKVPNEFYMLENRQAKKWDAYTYGKGMFVLHVDYDQEAWFNNTINNEANHQRMTYIPADNSFGTYYTQYGMWVASPTDMMGDPFPGSKSKTALTDTTTPAAKLYNANSDGRKYMGKPIENIAQSSDGLISFKFDGGVSIPTPEVKDATNVTANSFTANWGKVDEATSYNLEVVDQDTTQTTQTILSETFSKVTVTGDGTSNVSSKLDTYTDVSGWSGSVVYLAPGGLKVGSSNSMGYLYTPVLTAPESGKILLKAKLKSYNTDATGIVITVVDESGTTTLGSETCTPEEEGEYSINFTGITQDFMVKFATPAKKKRFYVKGVTVESASTSATTHSYTAITGTSYDVTGLTGNVFKYRVKAVNTDGSSAWSDYKLVEKSTAVEGLPASNSQSSTIYTISGQRVQKADRPGLYIQNGHVYVK